MLARCSNPVGYGFEDRDPACLCAPWNRSDYRRRCRRLRWLPWAAAFSTLLLASPSCARASRTSAWASSTPMPVVTTCVPWAEAVEHRAREAPKQRAVPRAHPAHQARPAKPAARTARLPMVAVRETAAPPTVAWQEASAVPEERLAPEQRMGRADLGFHEVPPLAPTSPVLSAPVPSATSRPVAWCRQPVQVASSIRRTAALDARRHHFAIGPSV